MPQKSQSVKPVSNTGLYSQNRFNQSLDWLTCTTVLDSHTVTDFKNLFTELCDLFGQEHQWDDTRPLIRGQTYPEHTTTPIGIIGGVQPPIEVLDSPGRCIIIIPGKAWQMIPKVTWLRVIKLLGDFGMSATRVDIAIDDYGKALTYDLIGDALRRGCARGIRKAPAYVDDLNPDAWTRYIGSRNSDKVVRIYNKSEQSKGEIDSIRLEVECKGDVSREVFAKLYAIAAKIDGKISNRDLIYYKFEPQLNSFATGALDFREPKEGEKNYSRRTRCEFWQKFIDDLEAEPEFVSIPTKKPALEDSDNWVKKQVMPTLTVLRLAYGKKGFDKLIEDGIEEKKHKLTPYKKSVIDQYHRDKNKRTTQAA